MRRGTTPKHTFFTDIDLTMAEVIYITYEQNGRIILEKAMPDIKVRPDAVEVTLTQEETLAFEEYEQIRMQIRARYPDGKTVACNIINTNTKEILKEGVI